MISEHVISVGLGILTDVLIEVGKKGYGVISDKAREAEHKKLIERIFAKHLSEEFSDILTSSAFEKFCNALHIRDYISDYFNYLIFGKISSNFPRLQKTQPMTISDLQEYLTNQMLQCYDSVGIGIPDDVRVRLFVRAIIDAMAEYANEFIGTESKSVIAFINQNANKNMLTILRRLEWLEQRITRFSSGAIADVKDNYDSYLQEYTKTLQRRYSQAHVYLMDKFDLDDFYVCPNITYINKNLLKKHMDSHMPEDIPEFYWDQIGRIDWRHIFNINNIIYIIGGAGYGKSLFLRSLIRKYKEMSFIDSEHYLLIYAELRDCYADPKGEQKSVLDMLQDSMVKNTGIDRTYLPKSMISDYINAGRCIILFDALDEVPREYRTDLHNKLITFFADKNINNKVCITSRSRGFIPDKNVHTLRLMPLTEAQIEKYVDNMIQLGRFDKENKEDFLHQAKRLVDNRFLNSFLVLSLLITIYKAEKDLPDTKLDLYQKCFEYIARKREKEKGGNFNWDLMRSLLMDNAFMELSYLCAPNNNGTTKEAICSKLLSVYEDEYSDRNQARNAIDEFLRFCAERTEVFVPDANEDTFKFFHRSFYEYFYSKYIVIRLTTAQAIYDELVKTDLDSEIFELVIAMLKNTDIQRFKDVLNLLCDNMDRKLSMGETKCIELHILSVVMGHVSNHRLTERFIRMLCAFAPLIAGASRRYYVHDMLVALIEHNPQYIGDLSDAYLDFAYEEILDSIRMPVDLLNRWSKDVKCGKQNEELPVELLYHSFDYSLSFYTQIIIRQAPDGVVGVLEHMKKDWLRKRFKTSKTGQRSYKLADGQVSQMIKFLREYEKHDDSAQN